MEPSRQENSATTLTLGQRVERLRQIQNVTRSGLATRIGRSEDWLTAVEEDRQDVTMFENLALAVNLKVTPRGMREGDTEEVKQLLGSIERDNALEGTARIRALHSRNEHTGTCEECSKRDYPDYAVPYPCPTIEALDG
ncbi:helix-turn-helix domain-containing protein [Streptomyces cinereoruber]|uniref:helix-turn-helix domain-containing protein n=1 Tax=Streptomyces cinereoruber TaxID=67260 RepID=UPI0036275D32